MSKPLILVGADKGGVGKTMMSRALLEYFRARGVEARAFDTQHDAPNGNLKRFYPDQTEVVDFSDSDGQMKVLDTLGNVVTVVDLAAGGLSPAITLLNEIGFIGSAKCALSVLHVLGNTQNSIDEIKAVTASISGARYVSIGNRITATKFAFPPDALDIPPLDARACEDVDASNKTFFDYVNDGKASPVLVGKVRHWLGRVASQFDAAGLGASA